MVTLPCFIPLITHKLFDSRDSSCLFSAVFLSLFSFRSYHRKNYMRDVLFAMAANITFFLFFTALLSTVHMHCFSPEFVL